MDINVNNSSGMMNGMPRESKGEKKVGPIIAVLVIILVIIIAALYFFGQKLNTQAPLENPKTESQQTLNTNTENQANLSSSTEVEALQTDLDAQLKDVDYSF